MEPPARHDPHKQPGAAWGVEPRARRSTPRVCRRRAGEATKRANERAVANETFASPGRRRVFIKSRIQDSDG
ncbi:MAG: hypothetical protein ACPIOQ_28225, partial [Promethearchaeia archaeon]